MARRKNPGQLATRMAMMPRDTNGQGNIFGGVLVSQMHSAGNIVARSVCKSAQIVDVVSRAMDAVEFKQAVLINDVISCYGKITRIGRTSVSVHVEVEADRDGQILHVTAADIVFIAVDKDGKAVPIPGGKKRRTRRRPTPTAEGPTCAPVGERVLALRQTMMPFETHGRGLKSIFGGALLAHMDLAASYIAHRACKNKYIKRCVTRVMNKVEFARPVFVNDTISCYGRVLRIGRTSITMHIDVEADRDGVIIPVTSADMVFVALDENGNPTEVQCSSSAGCTTGSGAKADAS